MPFYHLRCVPCDKEFSISASIADKTENRILCPECGAQELETVYKTAPAYIRERKEPSCPNQHICGAGCHHSK